MMLQLRLLLMLENCEVKGIELCPIADDVNFSDPCICEVEAEDAEEAPTGSDDEAGFAVNKCDVRGSGAVRGLDGVTSPELCATNFCGQGRGGGRCVGADKQVGIEDGHKGVEISGSKSGEERVDHSFFCGDSGLRS